MIACAFFSPIPESFCKVSASALLTFTFAEEATFSLAASFAEAAFSFTYFTLSAAFVFASDAFSFALSFTEFNFSVALSFIDG